MFSFAVLVVVSKDKTDKKILLSCDWIPVKNCFVHAQVRVSKTDKCSKPTWTLVSTFSYTLSDAFVLYFVRIWFELS